MKYFVLTVGVLLGLWPVLSHAQCSTCATTPTVEIKWRENGDWLYNDSGAYNRVTQEWHAWNGKEYVRPVQLGVKDYGVDRSRLKDAPQYSCNGNACTKEHVVGKLSTQITDDSQKHRITVIGTDRKATVDAIGKPAWAVVKEYAPTDWYVKENGFVCSGNPTVYVQDKNGVVIHRQDDGKEVGKAIERADPNYNPALDPDLRKSSVPDISGGYGLTTVLGSGFGSMLLGLAIPYIRSLLQRRADATQQAIIDAILSAVAKSQAQQQK